MPIKSSAINLIIRVLFSIVLFNSCISCKKDNQQVSQQMVNVQVREYKSYASIPGATIKVLQGGIDISCSCLIGTVILTRQTDADGICSIPETYLSGSGYSLSISKVNYWPAVSDFQSSKPTIYQMQNKAQLRVHLIKNSNYPDHSIFQMNCTGEQPESTIVPFFNILLPTDSTFTMDVYGGQTNQVSWKIMDNLAADSLAGGNIPVEASRVGITDMQIKY
jgi:hypothetical protein